MDDFVRAMHTKSALLPAIEASTHRRSPTPARRRSTYVRTHVPERRAPRRCAATRSASTAASSTTSSPSSTSTCTTAASTCRASRSCAGAGTPRSTRSGRARPRRTARSPTSNESIAELRYYREHMLRPPETNADATLRPEELAERAEERGHRALARRVAHEADAPRLAGELAEPAADLDAVGLEQRLAQRRVVGAVGQPRGGELGEPVALGARPGGSRARASSRCSRSPTARWRAHAARGPRRAPRRARRAARTPSRPARCGGTRGPSPTT